jgi:uncharacterized membrane protein YkoI
MRKAFIVAAALALPFAAHAKDQPQWNCSIKAKHANEEARKQAKVGYDQAKATAVGAVKGDSKQLRGGGLEVDRGCLVYRYDVEVAGQKGVEEVVVDAGTGAILAQQHESAVKQTLETAGKMAGGKEH